MIHLAIAILLAGATADDGAVRLTLLDGTSVVGRVSKWDGTVVVVEGPDGQRDVLPSELLDVRFPCANAEAGTTPAMSVELVDGTRLAIAEFTTRGRTATIATPYSKRPVRIATAKIARVDLLAPTEASAALWRQIAEREVAGDVILVSSRDGAKLDYLHGVVGDVTADEIAFDWDGQQVAINRAKAAGVAYFHAERQQEDEPVCELALVDGSTIPVRAIKLDEAGHLNLTTLAGMKLSVALDRLTRADFSRGKLVYLSDLEPSKIEWTPRIALPAAATLIAEFGRPRNNTSFAGSPLALAWPDESLAAGHEIRTYDHGLAIRSRTDLEYRLPAAMKHFTTIAGIDPATAVEGHVVLEIRADAQVLWEGEIDGKRAPVEIKVDLGSARRLQFHVDYGRNLDYGDCVHLVEARVDQMTRPAFILCLALLASGGRQSPAQAVPAPDPDVLAAQSERVAAVSSASAATVAIFDSAGAGGGSGVIISPDGFALTNFHVVAPCGPAMKCGLNDGKLYDAVVVGIDPVGDVALIQLLGRDDFPVAEIGDSDGVETGDWVFAAGNPFLLADDFSPSISYGILSGVHRYQFPAGTLLEYTDCLQTDAAINPGNSGGPLFDAAGRLIGINGRASFEKRGRVNVGVGYAISINQAMRFLSHLKSGRIVDHASLGATVSTQSDGRVAVDDILETSDVFRRGLRYGDTIVRFADREVGTANALKNILGVFPSGWRVPLVYRRDGQVFQTEVRLSGLHDEAELIALVQNEGAKPPEPGEGPAPQPDEGPEGGDAPEPPVPGLEGAEPMPELPAAVAERFVERRGYANYWYNEAVQQRLWRRYLEFSAVTDVGYGWQLTGKSETGDTFALVTSDDQAHIRLPWGMSGALFTGDVSQQLSPPRSGGLLLAIHAWQRLIDRGLARFGEVYYLGQLPHGPDGVVEDCLVGLYEGMEVRFFFDERTGGLTGLELFSADDADPCEIAFSQFAEVMGRRLPLRWWIRSEGAVFAELVVDDWEVGKVEPLAQDTED